MSDGFTPLCCFWVIQSCPSLCDPMDCSMQGFPIFYHLLEFVQTHVHWFGDAFQPFHSLSPLLLLPSIFPSTRVFFSESASHIRWPKYWSFSIVLPINNLSWFPLRLTGLISLLSREACHKDSRWREDSEDANIWNKLLLCFSLLLFPVWISSAASPNRILNNNFHSLNDM